MNGQKDGLDLKSLAEELGKNVFPSAPHCSMDAVGVIAHVHCLDSTVQLIRAIKDSGINPAHIYIVPKPYSSIDWVLGELESLGINIIQSDAEFSPGHYDEFIQKLLESACRRLQVALSLRPFARVILIDDGGTLSEIWTRLMLGLNVVSIQWTSSWQYRSRYISATMPKIDVARSAAKHYFESPTIVAGVLKRAESLGLLGGLGAIGVVGFGVVGARLAKRLVSNDPFRKVFVFDRKQLRSLDRLEWCSSLEELLSTVSVVFGCTGQDCLQGSRVYQQTNWSSTFLSCSSRDVEFRSMITDHQCQVSAKSGPFGPLLVETPSGCIHHVLNGGFPINFDRENEWEDEQEIFLTRGLVYLAFQQALRLEAGSPYLHKLDPLGQQFIVRYWLRHTLQRPEAFNVEKEMVESIEWWKRKSRGVR